MKIEIPCANEHDCQVAYDTVWLIMHTLAMEGLSIKVKSPLCIDSKMDTPEGPVVWSVQLEIDLPGLPGSLLSH